MGLSASLIVYFFARGLFGSLKELIFGQLGIYFIVSEWDHALLYLNGRFARLLPPGRHFNFHFWRRCDVYTLRKHQILVISPVDVASTDKLLFRSGVTLTYEIIDPRESFEVGNHDVHLEIAVKDALAMLAADHTLDAFLSERGIIDEKLLAMLASPVAGCTIRAITITTVMLPPEIRRMFNELQRAKLEAYAAVERARGEYDALRSLTNAARLLKSNPDLINLHLLEVLSAADGKRHPM